MVLATVYFFGYFLLSLLYIFYNLFTGDVNNIFNTFWWFPLILLNMGTVGLFGTSIRNHLFKKI